MYFICRMRDTFLSLLTIPGRWFNKKISSYQYSKSHCGDKTVVSSSYLHNGIYYTDKVSWSLLTSLETSCHKWLNCLLFLYCTELLHRTKGCVYSVVWAKLIIRVFFLVSSVNTCSKWIWNMETLITSHMYLFWATSGIAGYDVIAYQVGKFGSYLVCKVSLVVRSWLITPRHAKLCELVGKWPAAILTGQWIRRTEPWSGRYIWTEVNFMMPGLLHILH